MATRTRARPPAAQVRDNLPLKDPGLILKEKIAAAEANAAKASAPVKDELADPGLILKEKILTGQIGNRVATTSNSRRSSAVASVGSTTQATTSKVGTPYKLRAHRARNVAASANGESSAEEGTGETAELTKEEQQKRDLFGEDHELERPVGRVYTPRLTEAEMETRSVDQLESYAVIRSQDVSQNIRDCVKVAEETTGIASATMEMLHEQGGQIRRSHLAAVRVEEDLTVSEKLLGSLGGLFSRRWKPKKGEKIKGPQIALDPFKKKNAEATRRALYSKEDFDDEDKQRARERANKFEGLSATDVQLEMEKEHQDEALEGLGDIVSKLKDMTYVMNEEVEKQTAAIGGMENDVVTINDRVKQSYNRTRYLVGR
ncbi:unnamed protein product [Calypogeia fissa]